MQDQYKRKAETRTGRAQTAPLLLANLICDIFLPRIVSTHIETDEAEAKSECDMSGLEPLPTTIDAPWVVWEPLTTGDCRLNADLPERVEYCFIASKAA